MSGTKYPTITARHCCCNDDKVDNTSSGSNSGTFSAGRMLYTLGVNGQAPKVFTKVTSSGVPIYGTVGVMLGLAIGVILSYIAPENLFVYVYSASVLPGMVPWFVILISQIRFRKEKGAEMVNHPFKMPFAPFTNYVTIAFLIMVLIGMWFNDDTRVSLVVGIIFLALVVISYYVLSIGSRSSKVDKERK